MPLVVVVVNSSRKFTKTTKKNQTTTTLFAAWAGGRDVDVGVRSLCFVCVWCCRCEFCATVFCCCVLCFFSHFLSMIFPSLSSNSCAHKRTNFLQAHTTHKHTHTHTRRHTHNQLMLASFCRLPLFGCFVLYWFLFALRVRRRSDCKCRQNCNQMQFLSVWLSLSLSFSLSLTLAALASRKLLTPTRDTAVDCAAAAAAVGCPLSVN